MLPSEPLSEVPFSNQEQTALGSDCWKAMETNCTPFASVDYNCVPVQRMFYRWKGEATPELGISYVTKGLSREGIKAITGTVS